MSRAFFVVFLSSGLFALLLRAEAPAAPKYPDKARLLVYKDEAGKERPVRTKEDWAKRRAHILAGMQEVMGALPPEKNKVPLDVKESDAAETPKYTRKKLTFSVEKGERMSAWLLVPAGL